MRFEDEPDVSSWRPDPGQAHGPNRLKLRLIAGGIVGGIGLFCLLPFGGWFDALSSRWSTPVPKTPPVATVSVDRRLFNGLAEHHRSDPLPSPPPAPLPLATVTETTPEPTPVDPQLSAYDALLKMVEALSGQVASLQGQLNGKQTKPTETKPAETPPKAKPVDPEQQKRVEDAKRKREAMLKSPRGFLTRPKEDKPGMLHALQSPFSLAPSETIPCTTAMAISSDMPGAFVAIVSADVKDTATRTLTVIPRGSKFVLTQRKGTIFGDSRLGIEAQTLTFPGGSWLKLTKHTVTDTYGTSGMTGNIDRHSLRIFGSILITGVLRGGTTIAMGGYDGGVSERIGGAVVQEGAAEGTRQARQFMNTSPTIEVKAGEKCQLLLEEELVLTRAYR